MRRFVHSFWTKPCAHDHEKLKKHIMYFATSLVWLKKHGFPVVIHTDTYGKEIFKKLPYDKVYTTLDNIPDYINPQFYAYGKFVAMEREELGSVHLDGDVFIKTKELGDRILNFQSPVITQIKEPESTVDFYYHLPFFKRRMSAKFLDCGAAFNCGIVGISDQNLKESYFSKYFQLVELLNQIDIPENIIPDLVCEQMLLYYLAPEGEVLLKDANTWIQDAREMGFQHIPGYLKFTDEYLKLLSDMLKELNFNIFQICQNI